MKSYRYLILGSGVAGGYAAQEFAAQKVESGTGSSPRHLDIPGAGLRGVFYLRSLEDSRRLRRQIRKGKQAVIIGGGFIGMEVASVLRRRGMHCTLVFPQERIWHKFFPAELSRLSSQPPGGRTRGGATLDHRGAPGAGET